MTSSTTSGRLQLAFTPSQRSPTSPSETAGASNFKIYHNVALDSLYISTKMTINYFRSATNRINAFAISFLITVQPVSNRLMGLEREIQVFHFMFVCNPFDICAPGFRNVAQADLPPSARYANGYYHTIVVFKSHIRVRPHAHGHA